MKKIIKRIYQVIKKDFPFFFALTILISLLFKNPYSDRNLIANLEPFPDAQYYTTTPRCFLSGQSWKMCRLQDVNIEGIGPAVPPAYPLTLLAGYLLNFDVRTFYFINILLSFISLALLYKVSQNFFKNQVITAIVLFLYTTNYFIYWFPTLAMAENLLLPLFLTSILLIQTKETKLKSFFAGVIAASFYATKYAFAPLTIIFPLIYFIKILLAKKAVRTKFSHAILILLPAGIILSNLVGIPQLLSVLNEVFNGAVKSGSSDRITSGGGYFSINYFTKNFQGYSNALLGRSSRFLWHTTPLVERWIALPSLFALVATLKKNKHRLSVIYLISSVVAQLLFISTFYVVDIRYVYHFLPVLLLGFGFFLNLLRKSLFKIDINFYAFIAMIAIVYLGSSAMRLKSVIMINLKYAETPWWYLSQIEMNNYFDEHQTTSSKPFLITLSSPFMTDNYSNNNYDALPLDAQQDFRGTMNEVWGPNNYENLIELYKNEILNNREVFITNYGVSAANHFKQSYKEIENNFTLEEVSSGCYKLCNIYQLQIKE